jgi:putative lipoprotein
MKKSLKVIGIVLGVIVILGIVFFVVDYNRVQKQEKPIFCIQNPAGIINDGGTVEYFGLGYKVIDFHTIAGFDDIKIGTWFMDYNDFNEEMKVYEEKYEEELNKNKEYVINLFELKEISSITIDTLAQYDNKKEFKDKESIEEIYEVFADKKTNVESVNDIPVNPDILYFVKFKNESGNYKSAYIYKKGNQYYIEQPYNGIYQITEDEYTKIEEAVK